jgi:hypothetical protein
MGVTEKCNSYSVKPSQRNSSAGADFIEMLPLLLEMNRADTHYFPIATRSVQRKERMSYVEVMSVLLSFSCYHPITIGHIL